MDDFRDVTFIFRQDDSFKLTDISRYFYYVRIMHGLMLGDEFELRDSITPDLVRDAPIDEMKEHFQKISATYTYIDFENRFYFNDLSISEPVIKEVTPGNSMTVVIGGCLIVLVVAAIVSGGKVDLKNMTFELPPIGHGLKSLMEVFDRNRRRDESLDQTINIYVVDLQNSEEALDNEFKTTPMPKVQPSRLLRKRKIKSVS